MRDIQNLILDLSILMVIGPEHQTYVNLSERGTVKINILWEIVCLFTNSKKLLSNHLNIIHETFLQKNNINASLLKDRWCPVNVLFCSL